MDWGIPSYLTEFDILGFLWGILASIPPFMINGFSWLVAAVGTYALVTTFLLIGFLFYIVVDLFYHRTMDIPAAVAGGFITNFAKKVIIFLFVLGVVFTMMHFAG